MSSAGEWKETAGGFERGLARATWVPEFRAFVIQTFGENASTDFAFDCIKAARTKGQIAVHESNRTLVDDIQKKGLAKFGPFVGLPFKALGVVAIKQS